MMKRWYRAVRRLRAQEQGSAVVEFALVVPILFLLVWGALNFARAYQRLNVLTGALREGARLGSTQSTINQTAIRTAVANYSNAFGFSINTAAVSATLVGNEVRVSVTDYTLFSDLPYAFGLNLISVSRRATFRWERS
jgi:Flp pilus assembly protein TadG